jgi:hypothetical protein
MLDINALKFDSFCGIIIKQNIANMLVYKFNPLHGHQTLMGFLFHTWCKYP